jgi:PAS domain S-box-containing protein
MDTSDASGRTPLETQLRASNARWQAVIESAVDGILVIDQSGRIETVNPAAERLFGYTEAELVGQNVSLLMPSPHREEHDRYLSRYLATGEARIIGIGREVTGLKRDGTTFPLHLSVGEIVVEGERRFTGILHDLSRRVRMEEQLREQTALARLGEMAAVLAHEIKNPLAGIRGVIQVIAGRMQRGGAEADMMGEVIARIDALDALMKDVLVFARPRRPKLQSVEIVPLVRLTAELLKQDADLRDLEMEVHGASPAVNGDPEMLKMVFQNLLLNAAHATKNTGRIRIDVSMSDDACKVTVEDNGPGIPREIHGKIFTPFFTTKSRGTGLGLATAKRFVEAHQGEISIECPPDGGTVVHLRLPLRVA